MITNDRNRTMPTMGAFTKGDGKLPALAMVGGDDVEESLSRTAKVELPGGFQAEISHYIDRNHKGRGSDEGKRSDLDTGVSLRIERPLTEANGPGRVRVELLVRDWPEVKAAVEAAIAKLAPETK